MMSLSEAVQALRDTAASLEDNEDLLSTHARKELRDFCGEVEDLAQELADICTDASDKADAAEDENEEDDE